MVNEGDPGTVTSTGNDSNVSLEVTTPSDQNNRGINTELQMIQWERDLLKRERELLQRERELLSETSSIQQPPRYRPKDVVDLIPEFEPGKIHSLTAAQWITKVESTSGTYQWDDGTTLLQAVSKLRGAARLWYDGSAKNLNSWINFKDGLLVGFPTGKDESDVHLELMMKRKRKEESFEEYFYSMMNISGKGSVSKSALIKYIITGIGDQEMTRFLALSEYETPEDLLRKIKNYEDIMVQNRYRRDINHSNPRSFERRPVAGINETRSKNDSKCYNCNNKGHLAKDCPDKSKGIKCFSCDGYGHKATECQRRQRNGGLRKSEVLLVKESQLNDFRKTILIEGQPMIALIDTGSSVNLIKATQYLKLGICGLEKDIIELSGIGKSRVKTLGKFQTKFEIDEQIFSTTMHVVPDDTMTPDIIIGNGVLENVVVTISHGVVKEVKKITEATDKDEIFEIMKIEMGGFDEISVGNLRYKWEIENMIRQYAPKPTKDAGISMKITLTDDQPVYQHPRRLAACENAKVKEIITQWLNEGIIRESMSDYASPVVPVKKKDGGLRLCVDYRQVNKKTVKDRYPLPVIEDQLDKLRDAKIFSTIDLKSGFHHVPVEESSKKFTSFVTYCGQYEFQRMPFGLCNAPAVFQRFVNRVFQDLISQNIVFTYLDDLVIPAKSYEEGLERLKVVLKRAETYGLEINLKKCQFLKENIEYLGHRISNNTIAPSETKIMAVSKYPEPKTVKDIQSFLGLTGYFRKFVPHYAEIARPLSDILKKQAKFTFGSEQQVAFQTLKERLVNEPVLKVYNPDAYTELHTDASCHGYGAVLLQRDPEDNKLHPVYYMSRKTSEAERKYHSYELEVLAIVRALEKFRIYLLGISFKIITDCAAFRMTMEKKNVAVKIWRWAAMLQEFQYELEHRSGQRMKHCDALSRYPVMTIVDESTIATISKLQKEDTELKPILKLLENGSYEDYYVENGELFKKCDDDNLLVVPREMRTEIVRRAHEKGHFGVRKVEEMLKKEYWIPKLRDKIDIVIRNCVPCIMASSKAGKQEGFLNPIDKGDAPLHTYHLDHLGPLPSTKKSYGYLFVVVDAFSKFVWIYPTKSTGTQEVLQKLNSQQAVFGNPKRIITDRGAAFRSNEFKQFCKDENIDHIAITAGVPRGNGQVERTHQTIISVLTKLSIENPRDWFKHVSRVQQFLNSTYQRSIATSPFQLMIGTSMKIKDDNLIRQLIDEESIITFGEERDRLRLAAREQILKVQEENKKTYDRKRKAPKTYQTGQLVAIKRTQFAPGLKLFPKFLGPYKILKVCCRDRYEVLKEGTGEGPIRTTTSADQMKPWAVTAESDNDTDSELDPDDVTVGSPAVRNGRAVGNMSTSSTEPDATGLAVNRVE